MSDVSQRTVASINRLLLAAGAGVAFFLIAVGGWAATTEFSGAVVASGSLVVESEVKKVQHLTGGVVRELLVNNGDRVSAGDVVIRLDETVTQASLAIVQKALNEATARQARLRAEQEDASEILFPDELLSLATTPEVKALMDAELKLLGMRKTSRSGMKSQYTERIGQLRDQIQSYSEQIAAKDREIGFIQQELEGVRDLLAKKLVSVGRANALEREGARLSGERGSLASAVAQTKGKITETELQILQIDQDFRTEVGKELAELRGKISELVERKIAAEDQLKRIDIRAPRDGTVHQLAIHTVGGVVAPGETLMLIVPTSERLAVEAKVAPQEIEQIHQGQRAMLRFSALNHSTTPEVGGVVSLVSADLTVDQRSGQSFYTVRIAVADEELARLHGAKLTPGMPVEAFLQTQQRTVLTYFTKPLSDQVARAFRER
jgi:HlyD family secretion protein